MSNLVLELESSSNSVMAMRLWKREASRMKFEAVQPFEVSKVCAQRYGLPLPSPLPSSPFQTMIRMIWLLGEKWTWNEYDRMHICSSSVVKSY